MPFQQLSPQASAQRLSPEARATLWRSLQTFNITRIVIALVLLLYLGVSITDNGVRTDAVNT